jgi:hypothetical protein
MEQLNEAFGVEEKKKKPRGQRSYVKTVVKRAGEEAQEIDEPIGHESAAVLVDPEQKRREQEHERFQQARSRALVAYHQTIVKAMVGTPEMFSVQELQQMTDLRAFRVLDFETWWAIQVQRERAELEAQQAQGEQPRP